MSMINKRKVVRISDLNNDQLKELIYKTRKRIKESKIRAVMVDKLKIKKGSLGFIDKYTKMGEIIYKNQLALKELISQQKLTNQLIGGLLRQETVERINIPVYIDKNVYYYTTKLTTEVGHTITDRETLVNLDGKGMIKQILCKGKTDNYGIFIMLDDNLTYDRSYSYFEGLSTHLTNISALLDGGEYILSMRNLEFQKNLRIDITSDDSTVFNNISIEYNIREDMPRGN